MIPYERTMQILQSYEDDLTEQPFMQMGEDVRISPQAVIKNRNLVYLGSHIAIEGFTVITTAADIGDYVHISYHVTVLGGANAHLTMEFNSHLAAGARLICAGDEHRGVGLVSPVVPSEYRDNIISKPIVLRAMATVGTNAVIMPGVEIGEGAVVGANSFVSHDIPAWEVWAGTPARKIKDRPFERMKRYAKELGWKN